MNVVTNIKKARKKSNKWKIDEKIVENPSFFPINLISFVKDEK